MKYVKTFESYNKKQEDVYVTNASGKKKRIYIEEKENGTYTIGCNGTSLHKTNIDEKSLKDEIEKMKQEIKKDKY